MAHAFSWKKMAPKPPVDHNFKDDYVVARKRMVSEQLIARGIQDLRVLDAMVKLPRHLFVEEGMRSMIYEDRPLQIGLGQTISQPYIVAYMLEKLQLKPEHRVLEIGTGSGYQTALLSSLVREVFSIELLPDLLFRARRILKLLKIRNLHLKIGDGTCGWVAHAPFDAIIVAAGAPSIPAPYLEQLGRDARMILPVGNEELQELILVVRKEGQYHYDTLSGCRFVKLKGRYGFALP